MICIWTVAHHWSGDTTKWQSAISKESSGCVLSSGSSERLPCGHAGVNLTHNRATPFSVNQVELTWTHHMFTLCNVLSVCLKRRRYPTHAHNVYIFVLFGRWAASTMLFFSLPNTDTFTYMTWRRAPASTWIASVERPSLSLHHMRPHQASLVWTGRDRWEPTSAPKCFTDYDKYALTTKSNSILLLYFPLTATIPSKTVKELGGCLIDDNDGRHDHTSSSFIFQYYKWSNV